MLKEDQILQILKEGESDRVEFTESYGDSEKFSSERRVNSIKHFDGHPCRESRLSDLTTSEFKINYLPRAVDPQIIIAILLCS